MLPTDGKAPQFVIGWNGVIYPAKTVGPPASIADDLAAEARRRIEEPPGESVLDSGEPAAGPERVAALIRELQQVRVQQWSNPGRTDVSEDPVVQALVKEGDAAVEPLLKCLVEDDRLTRSQYTERLRAGPIIPVYEAAYTALFGILNVSFPPFEHDSADSRRQKEPRHLGPDDRRALAAKLEAVWRKNRGTDPLERAYATLRDDAAAPKAWFQAVDDIAQPNEGTFTNYRLTPPAMGGGYSLHLRGPFTPRGESLRGRSDPSVTELMIRRFEQLAGGDPAKTGGGTARRRENQDLSKLGKLLLALADSDGKSHLDDLRRLEHTLQARFRQEGENVFDSSSVVLQLFEKRWELGDATALQDYADHVAGLTPENLATNYGSPPECFRLMWRHLDEPAIARTAEKMFAPGSPWVPFVTREQQNLAYLIRSPLVGVPAFRRELDRGLGDTSTAGELTLPEDGQLNESSARLYTLDPLAPPKGSTLTYRLCDHYAHALSQIDGFPRCELYWPTAERDRAVEACRAFLARYGDHVLPERKEDAGFDQAYPTAALHFAVPDHAATPEDVRAGRAIFSLPSPARVCPLPRRPLTAERPGRQEDPHRADSVTEDGARTSTTSYTTRGLIWQTEEVLVNGRWERYDGFVGRYQLEKVPAAEIDFPRERAGGDITPKISGAIEAVFRRPTNRFFESFSTRDFVSPDAPVPIRVVVENHGGVDQIVPGEVMLAPGVHQVLPPGFGLLLSYSGKVPPRVQRFPEPPFDYGTWQETPLRGEVRTVDGEAAGSTLGSARELTVLEIDLRDYFGLSRRGSYRLRATFRVSGQPESRSNEIVFSVAGDAPRT